MHEHRYTVKEGALWGAPYRLAASLWRRSPNWFRSRLMESRIRRAGRDLLARFASRDDLYSGDYYYHIDAMASRSAPAIVGSVASYLAPTRVIDVGCGSGAMLASFKELGVSVRGLEYSPAALEICKQRGLEVYQFDIESDQMPVTGIFDVAMCFEVAEHVAAAYADSLVDLLVRCAPHVIFSAATPGQGGADHVNEQPHEYWISKFQRRGYSLIPEITKKWREEWPYLGVATYYSVNVMVFGTKSPI